MTLSVQITGIPALQLSLGLMRGLPRQVVDDMATIAYTTMRNGAGRHSPRPEGTGMLFRSLFREGTGSLTQTVGHNLNDAPHAEYVVFPTRPHWIRPKKPGGWLAWRSRFGGPMIFRREVWHPGYAGDNYRDAAINDALAQFAAIVTNRLKGI